MSYSVYYDDRRMDFCPQPTKADAATLMLALNGMVGTSDRPGMRGRSRHNKLAELHRWGWSIAG